MGRPSAALETWVLLQDHGRGTLAHVARIATLEPLSLESCAPAQPTASPATPTDQDWRCEVYYPAQMSSSVAPSRGGCGWHSTARIPSRWRFHPLHAMCCGSCLMDLGPRSMHDAAASTFSPHFTAPAEATLSGGTTQRRVQPPPPIRRIDCPSPRAASKNASPAALVAMWMQAAASIAASNRHHLGHHPLHAVVLASSIQRRHELEPIPWRGRWWSIISARGAGLLALYAGEEGRRPTLVRSLKMYAS